MRHTIRPSLRFILLQPFSNLHCSLLHLVQYPVAPQSVAAVRHLAGCSYTMKMLQVAAAVCVVVMLVASEMVATAEAAGGCDIVQLVPCMAASKNAKVVPSKQCCSNVAKMGQGMAGAKCLCSLLSSSLAKSQGVVPRIALGIPQKCRIPVPRGFVCQGIRVPGS